MKQTKNNQPSHRLNFNYYKLFTIKSLTVLYLSLFTLNCVPTVDYRELFDIDGRMYTADGHLFTGKTFKKNGAEYASVTGQYFRGLKSETWSYFDVNGVLLYTETYIDGKLTGPYTSYENGLVKVEGQYVDGARTGKWTFYNGEHKNCSQKYHKDQKEGSYQGYGIKSGNLVMEGQLVNAVPFGKWFHFQDSEKDSGIINSITCLDGNNKECRTISNVDARLPEEAHDGRFFDLYRICYTAQNVDRFIIKQRYEYSNGLRNGHWTTWNKWGVIVADGVYKDGFKQGTWITRYDDGSIKSKGKYVNGLEEGVWTHYYKNGKNKMDGNYILGRKDGKWTYYGEDGSRTKTRNHSLALANMALNN